MADEAIYRDLGRLILTELPDLGFRLSSLGETSGGQWIAVLDGGPSGLFASREAKQTAEAAIVSALATAKVRRT